MIYIKLILFICLFLSCLITGCSTTPQPGPGNEEAFQAIFWPPPPQKPRISYVTSISGPADIMGKKSWFRTAIDIVFGSGDEELRMLRPYGIFVASGRIYVTDPGIPLVHICDMKERSYSYIFNADKDNLASPIGIAVEKNGIIYVSDSVLRRVLVFSSNGKYLRDIGSHNVFMRPAGIAADNDRIYVVDTHAHKVFVFRKDDGKLLFDIGRHGTEKGNFHYPTNIFIAKDGLLYITDSLNFRIQILDRDGNFLSTFGKLGNASGNLSKPKGIAVDSDGHIYVADAHFDNIQIFDAKGTLLLSFGKTGSRKGDMILPAGIYIDEKDKIYVADSYNRRIQVFQYLKEN